MKKIKFGIAGLGRMGSIHLENLANKFNDIELVAISDINPNIKELAEKYSIPNFYNNYQDLVNNKDIDAVVICSPTNFHADHIMMAAKSGKEIFCEKPMDLSLDTVSKVIKTIDEADINLFLAFNRRFDPNFKRVKEIVSNGNIGEIQIIKITSRDPSPPPISYIKTSGGLFLDMSIHDFDMARFISGKEIVEVDAKGVVFNDVEIEKNGDIDTAVITLTLENNAMVVIDNSRKAAYGYDQRIEVFGSKGMCGSDNKLHDNFYLFDKKGSQGSLPMDFFMDRYSESYYNEMKSFIECLKNNKKPPVNGKDGLMALVIGLAAKKSMQEKRRVKISEIL